MALTCACGKCDTSEIERKGELLELCLKTSHDEAVKATNALWRSRIQKRIDELFIERAKIIDIGDIDWEYKHQEILLKEARISELEGLLK